MVKVVQTETYKKWFKKLKDYTAKFAIGQRIERMQQGNFGDSKSVGDGVFELRVDVGKEIVILLVGGDKSTQDSDIVKAKKMAKEF